MNFKDGFLYRRLGRWIPCIFPRVLDGQLELTNKYDLGSFNDVFINPFYWRLFDYLDPNHEPKLVLDLGGHCGHFSILCDIVIRKRFQRSIANYYIFEGQKSLIKRITKNLSDTGLQKQCRVIHGLVGLKSGVGKLNIPDKSRLTASLAFKEGSGRSTVTEVPFINIEDIIGKLTMPISIMKVDIEGAEYDLFKSYPALFQNTKILIVEMHGSTQSQQELFRLIEKAGLYHKAPDMMNGSDRMSLFLAK